ncbi:uncharacterized protein [Fopius arisanus]|uniref:F-box domain-containing protein n=1 Tax=Fopius arisanus TaxID=64838 RepID=A0A9R1TDQ1_9HYME|nr:PREDICTED: uncharacterized protein LOC105269152 [Fopius arisanus]XP_011307490.1 PREDICTED: uncharacterized protein LOC105269152 [Fopius arisanus]
MGMNKGGWKFDEQEKALYIDIDEDDGTTGEKVYSAWDQVPDIILEEIFSYLTTRERYYASLVCRSWYRAFKLPNVWSRFTLEDMTLTRGKYNYYSGWQYVLDHIRTSTCLNKVGRNFRSLTFEPMYNFYNLYEFMNMISWYIENQSSNDPVVCGVGTQIRHLKFTFPCNMANSSDPEQIKIFGTGGKLLEAVKRLAQNLKCLRYLEFIDLMLDSREALYFLDEICANCTETLRKLVLINVTKFYCPLLHVGVFINLEVLVVSPQNLDEDVLELIGHTKLEHLHILQNQYSPVNSVIKLPRNAAWIKIRKNNPKLQVHIEVESKKPEMTLPLEFPEHSSIPCHSIIIRNPVVQLAKETIMAQAINFRSTLKTYAVQGLSKYYLSRKFSHRMDSYLVQLCRSCPHINTLMIRDKISTATILEIASVAKSLKYLYVRRNVVLKKCDKDWLMYGNWSEEHENWVKLNSHDYEDTEREVSKILGYRWHMLSEKEFASQTINLHS